MTDEEVTAAAMSDPDAAYDEEVCGIGLYFTDKKSLVSILFLY